MWLKIKAFFVAVGSDFADTWKRIKVLVFAIAGLIVYLEFSRIKDAIIAYNGKKEIDSTQKQDDKTQVQEDANNKQADALVTQANALPSQEQPVTEDWNTTEKP